jgi:uncharacterized protein YbcV (DUF1398 family)
MKGPDMSTNWKDIARATLEGSEANTMTFPANVKLLMEAGFDGYAVDFRRATRIYYRPDGETLELKTAPTSAPVAEFFDARAVKDAIREAQRMVPGYTYKGFCDKVMRAGCAGYIVSFPGERVLYFGRTAKTHTEYFPGTRAVADEAIARAS